MLERRCMLPMQLARRGPPHVAAHHHLARVSGQALCNRADGPLRVLVLVLHGLGDKAGFYSILAHGLGASCIAHPWLGRWGGTSRESQAATGTKGPPLTHPRSPDGHAALRLAQRATGPHGHPTAGSHYPAAESAEAPTHPAHPRQTTAAAPGPGPPWSAASPAACGRGSFSPRVGPPALRLTAHYIHSGRPFSDFPLSTWLSLIIIHPQLS